MVKFPKKNSSKEASEMMGQMRDMGEGGEMNDMLKNLMKNMGGLGKNARIDTNKLDRMTKEKERFQK